MQKTNIRERISQKVLPSQANKTVYWCMQSTEACLAVAQLASQLPCLVRCRRSSQLLGCSYTAVSLLARIGIKLVSYQLTQFSQVKKRYSQIKLVSQLACQSSSAPQYNFTSHLASQLASYLRYVRSPQLAYLQLVSNLTQLGPVRFPGITENAGNHGNNRKFHKND